MKATCEREIFKLFTGLPVRPSHKFGFRSSVSKSGLPGEGRHEGLVPRNDVLTNGFIWFSRGALHGYFLYLVFIFRVRSIGKSGFRICNRTRNPKTDFHAEKSVFGFLFYHSIGKSEKGFAKLFSWTVVFFLLSMCARARPLFLRTVFQILFRISQSNGKKESHEIRIWIS